MIISNIILAELTSSLFL